jgi:N-acetylglucosaminyldiphosphoundecaprenol N-acetyl-beta-D-mannosaminyltransferase
MSDFPKRYDVFGADISLTTVTDVVGSITDRGLEGVLVVIANVHSVMTSRRDPALAKTLAGADVVTPDGVPLVWALKASGHSTASRVTGIDVMTGAFDAGRSSDLRHFLYGSTESTLDAMVTNLSSQFPGARIVGVLSPHFRELTDDELDGHAALISDSGADVVWVGLGMPKQEEWMARMRPRLPGTSLVGVGAAFDWLAGTMPMAPQWMRDRGLEWLFRLVLEPRRMWRRYVYNNPAFLMLLIRRWIGSSVSRLFGRGTSFN